VAAAAKIALTTSEQKNIAGVRRPHAHRTYLLPNGTPGLLVARVGAAGEWSPLLRPTFNDRASTLDRFWIQASYQEINSLKFLCAVWPILQ
jgi:hypothetical protein